MNNKTFAKHTNYQHTMPLLQQQKHYQKNETLSTIKRIKIVNEECLILRTIEGEIVSILQGCVDFSKEEKKEQKQIARKGELLFLPPGKSFYITAKEDSLFLVFCYSGEQLIQLKSLLKEKYINQGKQAKNNWFLLTMRGQLYKYMDCLAACLEDGFTNNMFYNIKIAEFLVLLKGYYTKEELTNFIQSLSTNDTYFTHFIYENYDKVKTVREFAQKANLSLSSFEKEFKKVFNVPPYRWMKQRKTEHIYNEICYGVKPLKVISEEFGFSSTSQMSDFCKKEFGIPPGRIREIFVKK